MKTYRFPRIERKLSTFYKQVCSETHRNAQGTEIRGVLGIETFWGVRTPQRSTPPFWIRPWPALYLLYYLVAEKSVAQNIHAVYIFWHFSEVKMHTAQYSARALQNELHPYNVRLS